MIKKLLKKYQLKGDVIDIGAGESPFEVLFKRNNVNYYKADFPKSSEHYNNKDLDYEFDISKEAKVNKRFDNAIFLQVIEHVNEPLKAMRNINRLLKKNSILIMSCPFLYPSHLQPYNYFHPTKYGLFYLARKSGFKIEFYESVGGGIGAIIRIIYNIFMNIITASLYPINIISKKAYKLIVNFLVLIINILFLPIMIVYVLLYDLFIFVRKFVPKSLNKQYETSFKDKYANAHFIVLRKQRELEGGEKNEDKH